MFWLFSRIIAVFQSLNIAIVLVSLLLAEAIPSIVTPQMFAALDAAWLYPWLITTDHTGEQNPGGFVILLFGLFLFCTFISWIVWSAAKSAALLGSTAKPSLLDKIKDSRGSTPKFALYLRSFDTQKSQNVFNGAEFLGPARSLVPFVWPFSLTMDEAIAIGFQKDLPLVGLRSTSQDALKGAVEYQCDNDDWRALVQDLWEKSDATIIVPGRTRGVIEELMLAHEDSNRRHKTVLIMPPRQGDQLIEIEWDLTQERAAKRGLQLPKYDPRGRVLNYHGFSAKLGSAARLHELVQRALRHAEGESAKGEQPALAND